MKTNFKAAVSRLVLPEFLGPITVIFLSGLFIAIWGLLFQKTEKQLLESFYSSEPYVVIPAIIIVFALADFCVGFLLIGGVKQLQIFLCVTWQLLQLLLLASYTASIFFCPFVSVNIVSNVYTLGWMICSVVLLFIYKLYRIGIIFILIREIQEEKHIWKGKSKIYASYNYE